MTCIAIAVSVIWLGACGLIAFKWWLTHVERYKVALDAAAVNAALDELRNRVNSLAMKGMR